MMMTSPSGLSRNRAGSGKGWSVSRGLRGSLTNRPHLRACAGTCPQPIKEEDFWTPVYTVVQRQKMRHGLPNREQSVRTVQ